MKIKHITLIALMASICVIGSFIKVPGPIGSPALDSAPAFISVALLPPIFAGLVGFIGHVATALTSGMPLGPFHLLIAVEMLFIVWFFAVLHRKQRNILKWVFLIVANGIIAPLPFYFFISPAFYIGAVPSLVIATSINVIITILVMPFVEKASIRIGGKLNA